MTVPFMPLLGIDIGGSAVKVCEFAGKKQRKLKALGQELLPHEAVVDGLIQDDEMVEDAVLNLLERLKINPVGRRAALSLSGGHIEVKRLLVDANRNDLEDQMNYEAEQHFQQDIADLYFTYQQLDGWSEDPSRVPVVIVGASRETVDQYIGILRNVGMRTGVVDCSTLCLANIHEFSYPGATAVNGIVDVGSEISTLTLVCNGQFLHYKIISLGSEEYTRQLIQNLGVEFDNAEAMKITVGSHPGSAPEELQKVLADLNEALALEVQEALKTYFETSVPIPGVDGIQNIYLCGGGARTLGLESVLSATLDVPVQILNPFTNIEISPKQFDLDYLLGQGHVYSVAAGLALRSQGDSAA